MSEHVPSRDVAARIGAAAAPPAPTETVPAIRPERGNVVAGAVVAAMGVALFCVPHLVASLSPYRALVRQHASLLQTIPGTLAVTLLAVALVTAGAAWAADRDDRTATWVTGLVSALVSVVVLMLLPQFDGRRIADGWHWRYILGVGVPAVGMVVIWLVARRRQRLWWLGLVPLVVFAVVVWKYWTGHGNHAWLTPFRYSVPILGLLMVGVALVAERHAPGESRTARRQARDAARHDVAAAQAATAQAYGDPAAGSAPLTSEHTNTLAILALIFGLLGAGVVPVVLGHLAVGQIRRTGERGHGLAVAGLVLGYVAIAAGLAVVIWLFAVANSLS